MGRGRLAGLGLGLGQRLSGLLDGSDTRAGRCCQPRQLGRGRLAGDADAVGIVVHQRLSGCDERLVEALIRARGVLDEQRVAVGGREGDVGRVTIARLQAVRDGEFGRDGLGSPGLEGEAQRCSFLCRRECVEVGSREAHLATDMQQSLTGELRIAGRSRRERRVHHEPPEAAAQYGRLDGEVGTALVLDGRPRSLEGTLHRLYQVGARRVARQRQQGVDGPLQLVASLHAVTRHGGDGELQVLDRKVVPLEHGVVLRERRTHAERGDKGAGGDESQTTNHAASSRSARAASGRSPAVAWM